MNRPVLEAPRRNPFFGLLLLGGFAFVVTAVLCGIAVTDRYLSAAAATAATPSVWQDWFQSYGPLLLAAEFVGLLAATFAVAYFEDARQAEMDAARSSAKPRVTC